MAAGQLDGGRLNDVPRLPRGSGEHNDRGDLLQGRQSRRRQRYAENRYAQCPLFDTLMRRLEIRSNSA